MIALGPKMWNQISLQLLDLIIRNIAPENIPDPVLLPGTAILLPLCNKTALLYNTFASLVNKKVTPLVVTFCLSCYKVCHT